MNRLRNVLPLIILCFSAAAVTAQTPTPSPKPPEPQQQDPFAPVPAPPLPAGMTGSDTSDPRFSLKPGMYDAGESAVGIKHLGLFKKPDAFQLPNDPNDPKVGSTLTKVFGVPDPSKVPDATKLVL